MPTAQRECCAHATTGPRSVPLSGRVLNVLDPIERAVSVPGYYAPPGLVSGWPVSPSTGDRCSARRSTYSRTVTMKINLDSFIFCIPVSCVCGTIPSNQARLNTLAHWLLPPSDGVCASIARPLAMSHPQSLRTLRPSQGSSLLHSTAARPAASDDAVFLPELHPWRPSLALPRIQAS